MKREGLENYKNIQMNIQKRTAVHLFFVRLLKMKIKKEGKMTQELKNIFTFYATLAVLLFIMSLSSLFIPYIENPLRGEIFSLSCAAILFFIPVAIMVAMFRLGSND